jgi:hypothetical protein
MRADVVAVAWVCSECGGEQAAPIEARPSIDDRYAVGYCIRCSPIPMIDPNDHTKTKPLNRKTVQLVRSDVWDLAVLERRRQLARQRRLFNGKRLDDKDDAERLELRRRWDREAAERRRPA